MMTKSRALDLLDTAPSDNKPSRINAALTRADVVRIVRDGIGCPTVPDPFEGLIEKRVWQAVKDRKLPRFDSATTESEAS